MARGKRSRDRTPSRRAKGEPTFAPVRAPAPRRPSPAQIRRTAVRTAPEEQRTVERQQNYRAAMVRQVADDLRGIIQTPNRAPAQTPIKQPDLVKAAGVKAPAPRKSPTLEANAINRRPKVVRTTQADPKLDQTKVQQTCKKRPTDTAGNGNSRAFVPWCSKS